MTRFHIVHGTAAPDSPAERVRKRLRKTAAASLLQCHRCAGREVIETKIGVEYVAGRTRGGTKQILCATCWRKGERVVLA